MNSRWMSEAIGSIQRTLSNNESGLIRSIASSRVAVFSMAHLSPPKRGHFPSPFAVYFTGRQPMARRPGRILFSWEPHG
jgi:hypothetical protein